MAPVLGFYGGSFNPPHVAHQFVALYALEMGVVDEVIVAPAYRHVLGKDLAGFEHRLEMCRRAMAPLGSRVSVSDIERRVPGQSGRTLDALRCLTAERSGHQVRLIVGSDILAETHKWHRWDEICALAPPFVFDRSGSVANSGRTVALPDVASSDIRDRVATGKTIEALVPRSVVNYIAAEGLYQP